MAYLTSWIWLIKDRFKLIFPKVLNLLLFYFASGFIFLVPRFGIAIVMRMNRYTDHNLWDVFIYKNLNLILSDVENMIPESYESHNDEEMCLRRSLVLKNALKENGKVIEKGVLILTFTSTFDHYFRVVDIERLLGDYYVVLEPSWAGYCEASILQWARFCNHEIIVQATEIKDRNFLNCLNTNLIPVDFGASDWVDFRVFHPIPDIAKHYDSIYVTSYKPGKRHHVYFRAIAEIGDPMYRGALACGSWGKAKQEILNLIKYYGIERNIDIYESLTQSELNLLLNKAKVNVLFSKKEGSNRSVFEGFFSNVPAIVLKNNIGMNKQYINNCTGKLVEEGEVANNLIFFKDNWDKFTPRNWAMENISPLKTTEKLNLILKGISEKNSERWTKDIVPKVNGPEIAYFNIKDSDYFPSVKDLLKTYSKT